MCVNKHLNTLPNKAVSACISTCITCSVNTSDILGKCRFIKEKKTQPRLTQNIYSFTLLMLLCPGSRKDSVRGNRSAAASHSWIKNKGGLEMVAEDEPPEARTSPS